MFEHHSSQLLHISYHSPPTVTSPMLTMTTDLLQVYIKYGPSVDHCTFTIIPTIYQIFSYSLCHEWHFSGRWNFIIINILFHWFICKWTNIWLEIITEFDKFPPNFLLKIWQVLISIASINVFLIKYKKWSSNIQKIKINRC